MKTAMKSLRATKIVNVIKDWDRSGFNKVEKARTTRMLENLTRNYGHLTFAQFMREWFTIQRFLLQQFHVGIYSTKLLKSYLDARIIAADTVDDLNRKKEQPNLPMDGLNETQELRLGPPGIGKSQVVADQGKDREEELEDIMDSDVADFPVNPLPEPDPGWDRTLPGLPLKDADLLISQAGRSSGYPIRIGEPANLEVRQTHEGTVIEIHTDRNPEVELTVKIPYIKY